MHAEQNTVPESRISKIFSERNLAAAGATLLCLLSLGAVAGAGYLISLEPDSVKRDKENDKNLPPTALALNSGGCTVRLKPQYQPVGCQLHCTNGVGSPEYAGFVARIEEQVSHPLSAAQKDLIVKSCTVGCPDSGNILSELQSDINRNGTAIDLRALCNKNSSAAFLGMIIASICVVSIGLCVGATMVARSVGFFCCKGGATGREDLPLLDSSARNSLEANFANA